jgi:hypothetical protein
MAIESTLLGGLVTFLVSLLIGGLGIHVGGLLVAGESEYGHAVWTALLGALAWAIAATLFGWIPLIGPSLGAIVAFVVYLAVVRSRYPGGWVTAAGITLVAWLAAGVALTLVSAVFPGLEVLGIPGV